MLCESSNDTDIFVFIINFKNQNINITSLDKQNQRKIASYYKRWSDTNTIQNNYIEICYLMENVQFDAQYHNIAFYQIYWNSLDMRVYISEYYC